MRSLRRRAVLPLALLVLTAAACGSDDNGGSSEPAASGAPTTTAPAATTTTEPPRAAVLEDPGAQPRQPLVLKVPAGTRMSTAMVTKIGLQLTIDGVRAPETPTPPTRMVMDHRVDRVDPDGTIHYTVAIGDVSVVSTPGVDRALARELQTTIGELKGVSGSGSLDSSGDAKEVRFDSSRITDPTLRSLMDSMSSQVTNLSAPFPKDPVGVGARWTVRRTANINGLVMDTTTRYTLRSRTGDRYELDFTQQAVSPPGRASLANLPPGAEATVESFSVESTARISGELTKPMPVRSTVTGSGGGTFSLTAAGQRSTMRQEMTLETTTSPA